MTSDTGVPSIRFDGQVVLVTGAGRGLGRAYARLLARRGAHVVVHDAGVRPDGSGFDPDVADAVVRELEAEGGRASAAYEDLGSRDACRALVERTLAERGRLDAAVLNAGFLLEGPLEALAPEAWERLRRVQLEAPLWLAQAALPAMKERRYGRFVLTVSGHGLYRTGEAGLAAYAVCKAATLGLVHVLADAGAPYGVLANAVSPVAATRMYRREAPPGELLPEHVAPGVVFLASSACTVSGAVLRAVGGRFSLGRYGVTEGLDLGPAPAEPEDVARAWPLLEGPLRPAE
ncbi:MAG TPA: SDR family NAD(P)-dependent oxidoreductase [Gaiellaceae bacterium]|nr:SDR family NAD(P)-dependent oxidoreductase [Gaiellaceae bacterium]